MIYLVTDRNDADREDFVIDSFTTREAAEKFATEWSSENGGTSCAIEEWESIEDAKGE